MADQLGKDAVQDKPKFKTVPVEPIPDEAPKRRGRPPGSKNRGPGRPRATLEPQIAQLLTTLNFVMYVTPFRDDALDQYEITALSRALDAQAKASPRFRKYLEGVLTAGSGGQLIMVVGMIGARRAARHGMIPAELDPAIGMMIASEVEGKPTQAAPTISEQIETENVEQQSVA